MPKMKTHKGLLKRMKVTARGKLRFKKRNASHLMSTKSGSRVRKLRRPAILGGSTARRCRIALGVAGQYDPTPRAEETAGKD